MTKCAYVPTRLAPAGPDEDERLALADYLGCHEEARAAAWGVWCAELDPEDREAAEYWLDVQFIEPCPEGQAV